MSDRFDPEGNETEEEKNILNQREEDVKQGENPTGGERTSERESGILPGDDTPIRENGSLPGDETVPAGEVDERISSYVKEHIRNSGGQRRNSAFRILFLAVLITIVVFFFVDYALMKRQLTSGWFAQSSADDEDESERDASGDGEGDAASAEDSQTEPTPEAAGEATTDPGEDDPESNGKAQGGDDTAQVTEGSEGGVPGVNSGMAGTEEEQDKMDSTAEQETPGDPTAAVVQYLVYIEVADSAEAVISQTGGMENAASGKPTVRQASLTGQEDNESEVTTQTDTLESDEQTHGTTGIIVEIGQSAIRILTDYSSVEYAETIAITLNGGETVQAQIETVNSNTGLALLAVSVSELSNETLKEIRTATWGDTTEITAGMELTLVTAGTQTEITESESGPEESGDESNLEDSGTEKMIGSGGNSTTSQDPDLTGSEGGNSVETGEDSGTYILFAGITVLSVSEKKQPDSVFTTYSFDASVEGCRILVDENGDIVAIGTGAADSVAGNTESEEDTVIVVAYCVDDLKLYIEKMVDGEAIPYVGITGVAVTDEIKESVSLDMPYGIYVWLADTGSPAYQAGILNGDIITAINGVEITTVQEMRDVILGLEAGVEASFTLMRQGGSKYREYTIEVTPETVEAVLNQEMTN